MSPLLLAALLLGYWVVLPLVGMAFAGLLLGILFRVLVWAFRVGK